MNLDNRFYNALNHGEDCDALSAFSRRAFFSLTAAVGALAFVGSTPDGHVQAWADENGNLTFVVYILSKEEVPIMAYDISGILDGQEPKRLKGVTVTITSDVDSSKSVTVTTDEDGFAPAVVKPLSWQSDIDDAKLYNFRGSISAKKDGYRELYLREYFVEAGTPAGDDGIRPNIIFLPMVPDDNSIYLREFSLDGEDVQFFPADGCCVWDDNTASHNIVTEVVTSTASSQVTISVLINGAVAATQTITTGATKPYSATVTFTDQWLRRIKAGDKLSVSLRESNGKTTTITSPLQFIEPLLDLDGLTGRQEKKISPGKNIADADSVSIGGFLTRPGDNFLIQCPIFPVQVFADPKGRVGVAVTLGDYTIFRYNSVMKAGGKEPTVDSPSWIAEKFSGESVKEGWDGWKSRWEEATKNHKAMYHQQGKGIDGYTGAKKWLSKWFPSRFTFDFGVNITVDLMGFGEAYRQGTDKKKATIINIGLGVKPQFNASVAVTIQVRVWVIPLFLSLDGSFTAGGLLTVYSQRDENGKWSWNNTHRFGSKEFLNYGVDVNLNMEWGVHAGLGFCGVLSAGARVFAYLSGDLDYTERKGLAFPHFTYGAGAAIDVIVQAFFFKKTVRVHTFDPVVLEDNWKPKSQIGTPNAQDKLEITDDDMDYVTDADMENVIESRGAWNVANGPSYAPEFEEIANLETNSFPVPSARDLHVANTDEDMPVSVNGVVPETQKLLYRTCYSNPRIRIVHTDTKSFKNDRAFMVRIVATEITVPSTAAVFASGEVRHNDLEPAQTYLTVEEDQGNRFIVTSATAAPANAPTKVTRTRIAISEWDRDKRTWGNAHILDFVDVGEIKELDRLNSYDLDFDVECHNGALLVAITSCQRPRGGKPTYLESESRQYLSVVRWDINQCKTVAAGSTFSLLNGGMSLFYPHLLMQNFDRGDGPKTHAVVYTYACTYKDATTNRDQAFLAATIFDDMDPTTKGYSGHRWSNPATVVPEVLKDFNPDDLVVGLFEVTCPDRTMTVRDEGVQRNATTAVFAWSNPAKSKRVPFVRSYVFCETFSIVAKTEGAGVKYVSTINQRSALTIRKAPHVVRLGRCNQRAVYSFPDFRTKDNRKKLQTVTFDQKTFALTTLSTAAETDKTNYFASWNGRRLYCVRSMDGETPGYDEKMVADAKAGKTKFISSDGPYNHAVKTPSAGKTQVHLYQLCEARWVDEIKSYYDFYPIAQLNHIPDNIGVVCATKTYTSFTMANIPNKSVDHADIYQVDVPVVLDIESRDVNPVAPFASIGDQCFYTIEILNTGNAPITAITMAAYYDGDEIEEYRFTELQKYVLESPDDGKVSYKETVDEGSEDWEGDLSSEEVEVGEDGLSAVGEAKPDKMALAGILWPGRRRTYCFSFKVPAGVPQRQKVPFEVEVTDIEDTMDDNTFIWPAEALADVPADETNSDVPLFAADDYVQEPVAGSGVIKFLSQGKLSFEVDLDDEVKLDPHFTAPEVTVGRGDVNDNGKVNIMDAQLAFDIANGNEALESRDDYDEMRKRADVDCDGDVTAKDARTIQHNVHSGW